MRSLQEPPRGTKVTDPNKREMRALRPHDPNQPGQGPLNTNLETKFGDQN